MDEVQPLRKLHQGWIIFTHNFRRAAYEYTLIGSAVEYHLQFKEQLDNILKQIVQTNRSYLFPFLSYIRPHFLHYFSWLLITVNKLFSLLA